MSDPILFDVEGAIATITLNRPEVLNAVNEDFRNTLNEIVGKIEVDESIRCVVLRGTGDHFCAGGDITMFKELVTMEAEERRRYYREFLQGVHIALLGFARLRQPVITRVQGAAAGIGLSFVLMSDITIAADDSKFTMAYGAIGLSPDGSSTFFLPRIVGLKKAKEIAFLNDRFDAQTALELGIINRVVPVAELDDAVNKLATRLANSATGAIGRTKALLNRSLHSNIADQLEEEVEHFAAAAASDDFVEGVTAFLEKRAPEFKGR
jgi:2-(1,2-epoxy-1,2-dihydrophenyl)acetyl-CoA isomerase